MTKRKIYTLLFLVAFTIVTVIDPIYGTDMWLQHIGTLLIFVWMIVDIRRPHLSWGGFLGLSIFTLVHVFGVRWCYTNVPYNEWFISVFDWSPQEAFGWTRNNFDRMVHLIFGLYVLPAAIDTARHLFKADGKATLVIGFLSIQFYSLFYELFEWGLTFALAPDQVEAYNGQQGDMWDPHKDMALALLGSIVCLGWILLKRKKPQSIGES